jgi:hypothetical protein
MNELEKQGSGNDVNDHGSDRMSESAKTLKGHKFGNLLWFEFDEVQNMRQKIQIWVYILTDIFLVDMGGTWLLCKETRDSLMSR